MICSKCGAQNMDGVSFCGNCGAQMESHIPPPPPPPYENYNQPSSQQPPVYGSGPANPGSRAAQSGVFYNTSSMVPPKNYMTEAIIVSVVSLFCCSSLISIILGIVAIIKANNVNTEFSKGNINEANANAKTAKNLTIWAAVVDVLMIVLFIILIAYVSVAWNIEIFEEILKGIQQL